MARLFQKGRITRPGKYEIKIYDPIDPTEYSTEIIEVDWYYSTDEPVKDLAGMSKSQRKKYLSKIPRELLVSLGNNACGPLRDDEYDEYRRIGK